MERYAIAPPDRVNDVPTGLPSLQSTIACALEQHLLHLRKFAYRLDGDNVRFGLNKDLGFDEKSRNENIRRIAEVRWGFSWLSCWAFAWCVALQGASTLYAFSVE